MQEKSNSRVSRETYGELLSGKLLRYEEIPLSAEVVDQLLREQLLKSIPSIRKNLLQTQCTRCGNQQTSLFATIPCKKCNEKHLYCRKCIEMGRVMACEPLYYWDGLEPEWPMFENPCTWTGTLTVAQQQAANQIKRSIIAQEDELLIWAVCGAGKTEMLFPGITSALEAGKRICIATPRTDVVRELKPRLEKAFEKVPIQALYGGSSGKESNKQLIIATTHQLLRFQSAFDVLIIDEIDAFPFHGDPSLPYATYRSKKETGTIIYLTATPSKKHQKAIHQKKLKHIFVPIRYHGHPLPVPEMSLTIPLEKSLNTNKLPKNIVHWLSKRKIEKRQLIIFVPTIPISEKTAHILINTLIKQGTIKNIQQIEFVHSKDVSREEKIIAFKERKIKVIVTTTILERGVTFPSVDVAILDAGHKVFDDAALVQIAGRAGRSANDPSGEVIFFHDGKTEAMVAAIRMIQEMNKRGKFIR